MLRRLLPSVLLGALVVGGWFGSATPARAQFTDAYQPMNRFFYYPYYAFPHTYWPTQEAKWPEAPGQPYRNPRYMAFPPFQEPHWRYEYLAPQSYHRGFHFWLDQM